MCLAIPGKIASISGDDPLFRSGKVDFCGIVKGVNLSCVPEAAVGDYVIVHVGMAISRLDESEANRVFDSLVFPGDGNPGRPLWRLQTRHRVRSRV